MVLADPVDIGSHSCTNCCAWRSDWGGKTSFGGTVQIGRTRLEICRKSNMNMLNIYIHTHSHNTMPTITYAHTHTYTNTCRDTNHNNHDNHIESLTIFTCTLVEPVAHRSTRTHTQELQIHIYTHAAVHTHKNTARAIPLEHSDEPSWISWHERTNIQAHTHTHHNHHTHTHRFKSASKNTHTVNTLISVRACVRVCWCACLVPCLLQCV